MPLSMNWTAYGLSIPLSGLALADGLIRVRLAGTSWRSERKRDTETGGRRYLVDRSTRPQPRVLHWRLTTLALWPTATPHLDVHGEWLLDWSGTQRWLRSNADASVIRGRERCGRHATCYSGHASELFHPLTDGIAKLTHVSDAFDPTTS